MSISSELCFLSKDTCNRVKLFLIILSLCLFGTVPICSCALLLLCLFAPVPGCSNAYFAPFQSFWNSRNFVSEPLELVAKLLELPKLFSKLWGLLQGRSGAVGNSFQSLWSSWNVVLELLELLESHFKAFGAVGS